MFVPIRVDPKRLTATRSGEFEKGLPSRPFSASAGATALVTGLVVVSYILATLLPLVRGDRYAGLEIAACRPRKMIV